MERASELRGRGRERVVDRRPGVLTVFAFDALEHRRIGDPEEFPAVVIDQIATIADFVADRGEEILDLVVFAGAEKDAVTYSGTGVGD